jgi:putative transposase
MTKKRWEAEEKLVILSEAEQYGVSTTCRKYDISGNTFYKWKHLYEEGGIDALKRKKPGPQSDPETKRLQQENEKLKQILADKELALQIKDELLKKTLQRRGKKG